MAPPLRRKPLNHQNSATENSAANYSAPQIPTTAPCLAHTDRRKCGSAELDRCLSVPPSRSISFDVGVAPTNSDSWYKE